MIAAPFKVVLDASVLYPFTLRDTLLRAAEAGFFQAYWSTQILDEVLRNLVADLRITQVQAQTLSAAMSEAFPEAMVTGHEPLIAAMRNHEKDRHVAAAAVKAGAEVIVTSNTKHFQELPEDLEAQSPDEFLGNLFDLDPDTMVDILKQQADDLRKPPCSLEDLLRSLDKVVPTFVAGIRAYMATQSPPVTPAQ